MGFESQNGRHKGGKVFCGSLRTALIDSLVLLGCKEEAEAPDSEFTYAPEGIRSTCHFRYPGLFKVECQQQALQANSTLQLHSISK